MAADATSLCQSACVLMFRWLRFLPLVNEGVCVMEQTVKLECRALSAVKHAV